MSLWGLRVADALDRRSLRLVPTGDLRDAQERPLDPRTSDLRHLNAAGPVQITPAAAKDRALVVLTEKGRDVLERHHRPTIRARQERARPRPGANSTTDGRAGTVKPDDGV